MGSHTPASIDPTWVYTTAIQWKHAPRGIDESAAFGSVVLLYPEGQYLEIRAGLIRRDKDKLVTISVGDGLVLSTGDWSRTDDRVIRIHSREVMWSTETVSKQKCEQTPAGPHCEFEEPHPEPVTTDTCGLEGRSTTHLAAAIHCKRGILKPAKLNFDFADLQGFAQGATQLRKASCRLEVSTCDPSFLDHCRRWRVRAGRARTRG